MKKKISIKVHQALCLLCLLGKNMYDVEDEELKKILETIEKNPDIPVTLKCQAGDVFSFQDSDEKDSTFERKKDLEILQKLDFFPGITIPARILFNRIYLRIKTVKDICFDCAYAEKKYYEKARKLQISLTSQHCGQYDKSIAAEKAKKKGIRIIIPPRTIEDLEKSKKESLKAMYDARNTGIRIRPHLLLCAVCQYGGGVKPGMAYDNLPELIQLILKEPETKLTLVEGADWVMCAPCPSWVKGNKCVHSYGKCGLPNQLRDMRVLQKLNLDYGKTVKAIDLYKEIFEKIPSTLEICRFDHYDTSMWHSGCGQRTKNNPDYVRGRKILIKQLNLKPAPASETHQRMNADKKK